MAIYGNDALSKPSDIVDFNDPDLPDLIKNMYETMRNAPISIAINGPLVGINKQIFIIEGEEDDNFNGVFINPKIVRYLGYQTKTDEICSSLPGIILSVYRHTIIELEWYDEDQIYHKDYFIDFPAKIIQHEIDHLNGIQLTDKADNDEISEYNKELENLRNESKPKRFK